MSFLIDHLVPPSGSYDDRHFLWKCATTLIFMFVVLPAAFAAVTIGLWLLILLNQASVGAAT